MNNGGGTTRSPLPGWKVLFLANGFTCVPEPSGGTKHFVELAKELLRGSLQLAVMTPLVGKENCELEDFHGPFRVLPPRWADGLGIVGMYLVRGISALVSMPWRENQLLLYGTSDMLPDVLPAFAARLLKRNSSFWVNCVFHLVPPPRERAGPYLSNSISFLAQRASLWLIRSRSDMVVVDNAVLEQRLVERGFDPERIFITHMGTGEPETLTGGPPLYDACYLGRFHPSKGILDLVSIWRSVCDRRPGSTLAVIGTGRQSVVDKFAREVQVNHLDDVITIYGYLPRDEADRVLSSSKTFLLPSREEGFGISLLEAMSYGVPPVAYGLTHFGDIFGEALTTAPIGNVQEFAEKALELLEDEALREKKATVSREFAAGFSWEIVAPREVEAIASAIRSSRSLQATGEGTYRDDT